MISPFGMNVRVGAHEFNAFGSLNINVVNSFVDEYTVLAASQTGDLYGVVLLDKTGTAFSDDRLPAGSPNLASFAERDFHLDGLSGGGEIQFDGELRAPSIQAVPEPSRRFR